MFNMSDKPSAQAAIFAEKCDKVTKQLSNLQQRERRLVRPGSLQTRSALGAVAMAAASGVSTSVVSSLIDELLTAPSLAAILHPAVTQEELANSKSGLTKFLLPDLVPTMVCLDLACTTPVPHQICRSLVDLARKRQQGEMKCSSCGNSFTIMFFVFLFCFVLFIIQGNKLSSPVTKTLPLE